MNHNALFVLLLLSGCAPQAENHAESPASETSLCQIVGNETRFEGKEVTLAGSAVAGSHAFEISLADDRCPNKYVGLEIPMKFATDAGVQNLIRQLYPGYPEDEAYTKNRVRIYVSGKLVMRKLRGLQSRILEVESIRII